MGCKYKIYRWHLFWFLDSIVQWCRVAIICRLLEFYWKFREYRVLQHSHQSGLASTIVDEPTTHILASTIVYQPKTHILESMVV